jgi:hypothetical protein
VRRASRVDRLLDVLRPGLAHIREDVLLVVRLDCLERLVRVDVLAADDVRDLDAFALELLQTCLQLGALRSSRRIGLDRLVLRLRRREDSRGAHARDSRVD